VEAVRAAYGEGGLAARIVIFRIGTALRSTSTAVGAVAPEIREPDPPTIRRSGHRVTRLLVLTAAAWALVIVAYVAHAAIVLPVILLVAVASLLRGGQSLLDRVMLAMGLLFGLTCAGALIFALWPWGLNPVPVAGVAFTVLIVLAVLTDRRPNLPRPRITDLVPLVAGAAVALYAASPLMVNRTQTLSMVISGEDNSRHISVLDAIRATGGYLFQHWDLAKEHVYTGMITYPQGLHMMDAILDAFVRSGTQNYANGEDLLHHYLAFYVLWYGFLTLSMVWAAQWIASGSLTLGRRIALAGVIGGFCVGTELFMLIVIGYASEVAGLAEMVLLVAILIRPVPRPRQQLLLVASLMVAVGFTYYLFLPAAGLAILIWLVRSRRAVLRHPRWLVAIAVPGVALAGFPAYMGLTLGQQVDNVNKIGPAYSHGDFLLTLGGAVVAGLLSRRALRSRIWHGYFWSALAIGVVTVAFVLYQRHKGMPHGYYGYKMQHIVIVMLALGLGSLTLHLPVPRVRRPPVGRALLSALPGALVAVVALAGFGLIFEDSTYGPQGGLIVGKTYQEGAYGRNEAAYAVSRELDRASGKPKVATILLDDSGYESYLRTLFLSSLEGTAGTVAKGSYNNESVDSPTRLLHVVGGIDGPVRLVANSDKTLAQADAVKAQYPNRQIEVVRVSG
jgi:hypothetical protein